MARTPAAIQSAGSTNATSKVVGPCSLEILELTNFAAYAVFFKIYDKASAPTVGTDIPIITIPVPATSNVGKSWLKGLSFNNGYAYAITKLLADSDTTAVLANDLKVYSEHF